MKTGACLYLSEGQNKADRSSPFSDSETFGGLSFLLMVVKPAAFPKFRALPAFVLITTSFGLS